MENVIHEYKLLTMPHEIRNFVRNNGLNIDIVTEECVRMYRLHKNKDVSCLIAFENELGGLVYADECGVGQVPPEHLSYRYVMDRAMDINDEQTICCVFLNFIDYLSYLTLCKENNLEWHDEGQVPKSFVILNNSSKWIDAMPYLGRFNRIDCYLPNDEIGMATFDALSGTMYDRDVRNMLRLNCPCQKTLNDYLMGLRNICE